MRTLPATHEPNLFENYGPHNHPNPLYIGAWKRGCRCGDCVETYRKYRENYHAERMKRDPDYRSRCKRSHDKTAVTFKVTRASLLASPNPEHANPAWAVGHSGYVKGCRCVGCVEGSRVYKRANAVAKRLTPEGRALNTAVNVRKYLKIKSDADRRARMAAKAMARRLALRKRVNEYKLSVGCMDCGYKAHGSALDFDHVRGKKSFTIAGKVTMGWARIQAEIAKCDVVCANCHRIRTVARIEVKRSQRQ